MERNIQFSNGIEHNSEVDLQKGEVQFYYANFQSTDSHGRRMSKKAFNRTVKNNKDKIYHLLNHSENQVIGRPIEFGFDETGAWVRSKLANTDRGKETLELYREGIYKYASFGFYIINSEQEGDVEVVNEAKIVEVSTVLHPANELATVMAVNGLDEQALQQSQILIKLDELLAYATQHSNSAPESQVRDAINFINNY